MQRTLRALAADIPPSNLAYLHQLCKSLADLIQQSKENKNQLQFLFGLIYDYYLAFKSCSHKDPLVVQAISKCSDILCNLIDFAGVLASKPFLRCLWDRNEDAARILQYLSNIQKVCNVVTIQMEVQKTSQLNDLVAYRNKDKLEMTLELADISMRWDKLKSRLELDKYDPVEAILNIQDRIDTVESHTREVLCKVLATLQRNTGEYPRREDWTVTTFDVDKGKQIAVGGFSTVFKGRFKNGNVIAIKEFHLQASGYEIEREVKVWYRLKHDNITPLLGASTINRIKYAVMPFYKNGDARNFLHNHPTANRVKIMEEIALGIEYLHSQGVVHGDLKGVNVMIDDERTARVSDFGLARIKSGVTSRISSAVNHIQGSYRWMSPERLEGSMAYAVDIWAMGMTFYELLSDDLPYGQGYVDEMSVRMAILGGQKPNRDGYERITNTLWKIMEKCWASLPHSRPDAGSIIQDLRSYVWTHEARPLHTADRSPHNVSGLHRGSPPTSPHQNQKRQSAPQPKFVITSTSSTASTAPLIQFNTHTGQSFQIDGRGRRISYSSSPASSRTITSKSTATIRKPSKVVPPTKPPVEQANSVDNEAAIKGLLAIAQQSRVYGKHYEACEAHVNAAKMALIDCQNSASLYIFAYHSALVIQSATNSTISLLEIITTGGTQKSISGQYYQDLLHKFNIDDWYDDLQLRNKFAIFSKIDFVGQKAVIDSFEATLRSLFATKRPIHKLVKASFTTSNKVAISGNKSGMLRDEIRHDLHSAKVHYRDWCGKVLPYVVDKVQKDRLENHFETVQGRLEELEKVHGKMRTCIVC